jgi:type I restriction enzyme M protein
LPPSPAPSPSATQNGASGASGATLGFENHLWRAAEELRGHVEPAEYKHVLLGLIFFRFATDGNLAPAGRPRLGVPPAARWETLRSDLAPRLASRASGAARGSGDPKRALAAAALAIERANPHLAGLLPFDARQIDGGRLAALIDFVGAIPLGVADSRDVLGRVYEYFLARFASAEGRSGGEYYTPRSVVELLVEMVRPDHGVVYDPAAGPGECSSRANGCGHAAGEVAGPGSLVRNRARAPSSSRG